MKYILTICIALICTTVFSQDIMLLKTNGKVVIGDTTQITTPGDYNLYVQNGILTESVKVSLKETSEWSDDSFEKTPTIKQVDTSIKENKHLINIPSASHLVENGYEIKNMDAKLLEQIEWLWQHTIAQREEIASLKASIKKLEEKK